jgi:hypothetical protein
MIRDAVLIEYMNVLIQFALNAILPLLEEAIKVEGPVALKWIEDEVAKLATKYNVKS